MTTAQDQQSRADLLPCPFCGGDAVARFNDFLGDMSIAACKCCGATAYAPKWNRRAPADQAARALPAGMEPVAFIQPLALAALQNPRYSLVQHQVTLRATKHEAEGVGLFTAAQVQAMGRVPPGWQAVPVEQTPEMMLHKSGCQHHSHDDATCPMRANRMKVWAHMLDAAPRPPAAQERKPLFWVRLLRDGLYEGPVHANSVGGKMMRDEKPDEWHPLYLGTIEAAHGIKEGGSDD